MPKYEKQYSDLLWSEIIEKLKQGEKSDGAIFSTYECSFIVGKLKATVNLAPVMDAFSKMIEDTLIPWRDENEK